MCGLRRRAKQHWQRKEAWLWALVCLGSYALTCAAEQVGLVSTRVVVDAVHTALMALEREVRHIGVEAPDLSEDGHHER